MHLRLSRTIRNGKAYEYAQLVESVRRPGDKQPTHRVIASLGALSALELDNLRAALAASREGKRVVIAPYAPPRVAAPDVVANLRYLDLAVGLQVLREWDLPAMLAQVLPPGDAEVDPAKVVCALVLQRLVDPDSKLASTEWFPRTALPELLDVDPARFNNTRVHRVLDALEEGTAGLMARLPRRYQEQEGAFSALFLDVSDAAFVGHGPSLAQRAKTKEGFVARKVGIVLLCNQRGYPLRWQVVPGAAHDSRTMLELTQSIAKLEWARQAPLVCDRAMGKTSTVMALHALGVHFVTALTRLEFDSYADCRVPWDTLSDLTPSSISDAKVESEAVRRIAAQGFEAVDDNLFVLDLGLIERQDDTSLPPASKAPAAAAAPSQAMRLCRQMCELVDSGQCASFEQARRQLQLGKAVAVKYRQLHSLVEDIQQVVVAGEVEHLTLDELVRLARLPRREQQSTAFEQLRSAASRKRRRSTPSSVEARSCPVAPMVQLRLVAYFNQERFVDKRFRAQTTLDEIRCFTEELNRRLAAAGSRRSRASIEAEVDRKLRSHDLLECFSVRVDEQEVDGRTLRSVALVLDDKEWARRRRHDGFSLLVAHPTLPHSAAALCRLYRAKDAVEKDFHVIKSVVEVSPVRHRHDDKVRAHVTLCMLALLVERTLASRLRGHCSAEVAIDRLEPCRLNRFANTDRAYALTRPTPEQKDLLRHLGMLDLTDEELLGEALRPRP